MKAAPEEIVRPVLGDKVRPPAPFDMRVVPFLIFCCKCLSSRLSLLNSAVVIADIAFENRNNNRNV